MKRGEDLSLLRKLAKHPYWKARRAANGVRVFLTLSTIALKISRLRQYMKTFTKLHKKAAR